MLWIQGWDYTIVGNIALNSTREHDIRGYDFSRVLIAHNELANMNRQEIDPNDIAKGSVTLQPPSQFACVTKNKFAVGNFACGAIPQQVGLAQHMVFDSNDSENSALHAGNQAWDVLMTNNLFRNLPNNDWPCIEIGEAKDVRIVNNTFVKTSIRGNVLRMNAIASNVVFSKNLYMSNTLTKTWGTNPIDASGPEKLASLSDLSGNVWPAMFTTPFGIDPGAKVAEMVKENIYRDVSLDAKGNPTTDIPAGARR